MPRAIGNTSPLLYLYRIQAIEWLSQLFDEVWTPQSVVDELEEVHPKITLSHLSKVTLGSRS